MYFKKLLGLQSYLKEVSWIYHLCFQISPPLDYGDKLNRVCFSLPTIISFKWLNFHFSCIWSNKNLMTFFNESLLQCFYTIKQNGVGT